MNTLKRKREYKKDSIYVSDLYTLTFDENETLESLEETVSTYSIDNCFPHVKCAALGIHNDVHVMQNYPIVSDRYMF